MRRAPVEKQIENMRRATSPELDRRTIDDIRAAMEHRRIGENNFLSVWEVIMRIMRNGYVQVGVAAAIVIAVGLGVLTAVNKTESPGGQKQTAQSGTNAGPEVRTPEQGQAAEMAIIEKLYEMKNTKALAMALGSASYEAKVAAANYLAVIGDANSVAPLQNVSSEWKGNAAENPFTKAAEAIKKRIETGKSEAAIAPTSETPPEASSTAVTTPERKGKPVPAADAQVIMVKVFDNGTGEPLAGALVRGRDDKGETKAETDAAGIATLKVLGKTKYMSIVVTRAGYAGQSATWRDEAARFVPSPQLFRLDRGTVIGGIVRNPEGQPIEAVDVEVYRYYRDMPKEDGTPSPYVRAELKTDKEGRWLCDMIPADMNNTGIGFKHPEYQSSSWSSDRPEAELRAGTAVQVLEHGLRLYGVVRNTEGQPIAKAKIVLGDYGEEVARTGEDGRFDMRNVKNKLQVVTVEAKSYAPAMREVAVEKFAEEQVFILDQGTPLRGKVVDANGAGVAKASISVDKWQGYHTIRANIKTDESGRFEYKMAPVGKMDLSIMAEGYREVIVTDVVADGQDKVFALGELVRVTGRVTDATTGEPVREFRFAPGIAWADQGRSISFQESTHWTKEFKDGQYDYTFDRFGNCYAVRIIAPGYLPADSRVIEPNERNVICDFALQRSTQVKGIVYLPNGSRAAGVTVYMLTRNVGLYLDNGRVQEDSGRVSVKTGPDGVFILEESAEEYQLVALGDAGVATAKGDDLKRSGAMTLASWGKVEGTYYEGSKPAAGRKLNLVYQMARTEGHYPVIHGTLSGVTDEQGHFRFERVRPGPATIDGYAVEVAAGETATVAIGGKGRTVKAELVLSEELMNAAQERSFSLSVSPEMDEDEMMSRVPVPAGIDSMTIAQVAEWYQNFANSEEGKKLFEEFTAKSSVGRRYVPVKVEGNAVTIEDVPAGKYILQGQVRPVRAGGIIDWENTLANVYHQFVVPEIQEGQLDIPLDIGKIKVGAKPADGMAPDFVLETADGRTIRLSDYRGKLVLLTICVGLGPDKEPEIANLKKIYEAYSTDERFAMLGIVPGIKSHPIIRVMMREFALPWLQGYAGSQNAGRIAAEYRLGNMSVWSVLVGADGKIIASGLTGEELQKKVAEALASLEEGSR